ncbi:hypothetical protein [Actinokineospora xionganensis]|uniref:Uncharacterized protein n=1 Tax=Actinokineospora xionganensis TaxID=2684470 RepID=A0ABR7L2P2_9PSEU|nr:hypothetical protein [Actinokineospora xionganensis]MBC6446960.1 hypothetical protein [Actinokineospora xionganensis]
MISTTSFAEYATSGRRRRTEIVAAQLVAGDVQFYRPILDAIRVAVSVGDLSVLARAVDQAELTGQPRAFAEIADGFVGWWSKARAVPIRCGASALRVGDVDLSVVPHLAVRSSAGDQVIMFHFKEQPLERDAAHAALRILQICMDDLVPGGTALMVDVRRGKEHRLARNVNLASVDAWLTASASAFASHLRAAL